MINKKRGITGFQIKIIALVLMLLDHIYYFFGFTDAVPLVFSWLGRISSGLFLFAMVEGYSHTSNKKIYFTRIYIMSVLMAIIKWAIIIVPGLKRGDGFIPENGILQTLAILIILFKGIDEIKSKHILKGVIIFALPFLTTFIYQSVLLNNPQGGLAYILLSIFIPSPIMVEGGMFTILCGLVIYLFKGNVKRQALGYSVIYFLWMIVLVVIMLKPTSLTIMFTDYYEWIGTFAALIFYFYNGEKGKSMKSLFYVFYPAHIYILYFLSILVYNYR